MALSNQFLLFLCLWCSIVDFPFTTAVISSNSKALSSNLPAKARTELVEGSGSIPPGLSSGKGDQLPAQSRPSDTEWNSSGVSPDDEDGDADDGAGSGKEIEGSGNPPVQVSANTRFPLSGTTTIAPAPTTTTKPRHQFKENGPSPPSRENDHRALITSTTPPLQRTTTTRAPPPFTINTKPPPQQYPPYVSGGESFEALKPGILAAISGGAVVGLLMTILLVMFIVYRMRKKDEGSYSLDEPHPAGTNHYSYAYQKASTKEFYA